MAINQLLPGLQLARCPSATYLAIKGPKTSDKGQIPTFSITFPSTSSQEVDVTLLPPLGVENVKIRENSEKIRGPPGDPLQPFLGP